MSASPNSNDSSASDVSRSVDRLTQTLAERDKPRSLFWAIGFPILLLAYVTSDFRKPKVFYEHALMCVEHRYPALGVLPRSTMAKAASWVLEHGALSKALDAALEEAAEGKDRDEVSKALKELKSYWKVSKYGVVRFAYVLGADLFGCQDE